eukprot:CAMPEP_0115494028 /NCGR_PEP_ID=MMETSP0271-20121206/64502_1 /TAXON_ID=71861 /ORGANISM="Scrippsiella trochoidea, Strain CCMP3099" /LENGTH=54 /DNA_ID=CAMNT_0002922581 /DNA_START=27 /DNA_END=188 /DNA_ORIENTATION=-
MLIQRAHSEDRGEEWNVEDDKVRSNNPQQARMSQGFFQGGIWTREPSSDKALKA